jgi:hypothetical protein
MRALCSYSSGGVFRDASARGRDGDDGEALCASADAKPDACRLSINFRFHCLVPYAASLEQNVAKFFVVVVVRNPITITTTTTTASRAINRVAWFRLCRVRLNLDPAVDRLLPHATDGAN